MTCYGAKKVKNKPELIHNILGHSQSVLRFLIYNNLTFTSKTLNSPHVNTPQKSGNSSSHFLYIPCSLLTSGKSQINKWEP